MKISEIIAAGLRQGLRITKKQVSEEELTTKSERQTSRGAKGDPAGEAWEVMGRRSF